MNPLDEITEDMGEKDSFRKDGFSISISYLGIKKFIKFIILLKNKMKRNKEE